MSGACGLESPCEADLLKSRGAPEVHECHQRRRRVTALTGIVAGKPARVCIGLRRDEYAGSEFAAGGPVRTNRWWTHMSPIFLVAVVAAGCDGTPGAIRSSHSSVSATQHAAISTPASTTSTTPATSPPTTFVYPTAPTTLPRIHTAKSRSHVAVFTFRARATAVTGTPLSFPITTTLANPAPSISTSSRLPGGVTLIDNGSGRASLVGTPVAGSGGVYPILIEASNGIGAPVTRALTLFVDQAPEISPVANVVVEAGVSMTPVSLQAIGFPTPKIVVAGLPLGIRFAADMVTGAPRRSGIGSYNVSVTAVNRAGSAKVAFTVTVNS